MQTNVRLLNQANVQFSYLYMFLNYIFNIYILSIILNGFINYFGFYQIIFQDINILKNTIISNF